MSGSQKKEESSQISSVYDYIKANYQEEWSNLNKQSGALVDWGVLKANRWEQFESMYQSSYTNYYSMYASETEFQSRMQRRYQQAEEYYEIYEVPEEERIDVLNSPEIQAEVRREMEEYAYSQASDSAALDAFNRMGVDVLQMDDSARIEEGLNAKLASEKAKNQEETEQLEKSLKEKAEDNPEYLVRGAPLRCRYGSHMRYLDMLETHGVYLGDKPVMYRKDCVVNENIMPFGICSSPTCTLTEVESFLAGAETDHEGNYLQTPDDSIITGIKCKPKIVGGTWKNVKENTKISKNATKSTGGVCYEAITTASYLICEHGGLIFPLSSGQLDYASYIAPFESYPYESEEGKKGNRSPEDQKAFEKWCELHDICPVNPGTKEYVNWYQNKIKKLEDKGASKKKIKAAYEECLDQAYCFGLDHMDEENRSEIRDIVSQYQESGALDEEEAKEVGEKYSGLRLDFGHNSQKNLSNATPQEDGFYRYYKNKIRVLNDEREDLEWQLSQAAMNEDYAKVSSASNELQKIREEKDVLHQYFSQEVERYDGYLDEERKKQAQEIDNLFSEGEVSR